MLIIHSLLIKDEFDAPLSKLIQKEYNALMESIFLIPSDGRTQKKISYTGGLASITDIIAYQIGWGNLLIDWYQAGKKGKLPEMPGHGFSTWNYTGLAQAFYKEYQLDSGQKQLKKFHDTANSIIEITEQEYAKGNLDKKGVWQWCTLASGTEWPLAKWIAVNSASPYKRAARLIKNYAKNKI